MRNPGGKGFSRGHPVFFRKGRRDRRAAEKPRLRRACSREEPPPWSPKESLSSQGLGPHTKLGVGLFYLLRFFPQKSAPAPLFRAPVKAGRGAVHRSNILTGGLTMNASAALGKPSARTRRPWIFRRPSAYSWMAWEKILCSCFRIRAFRVSAVSSS